MIDRKELKLHARDAMRETKPHPLWVTLMVLLILAVAQLLSASINGDLETYTALWRGISAGNTEEVAALVQNGGSGNRVAGAVAAEVLEALVDKF